jgi:release factor H-coupled RctB family protein
MTAPVRVIASADNWIDSSAVEQLTATAKLPGVVQAVGLPDLHPGPGTPVGAAFVTDGVLYPHLAGNDIGCGMALWRAGLPAKRPNLDRWVKKLKGLESEWDGDSAGRLEAAGVAVAAPEALGTIGGGNHFAELQAVDAVHDEAAFAALKLNADELFVLVHSGSRGLGEAVLREFMRRRERGGLAAGTEDAVEYLRQHDHAVRWATENRRLIADRLLELLGGQPTPVLDNCHNSITPAAWVGASGWLHRKGAAAADRGPVVIPGSRGTLSYLVLPHGDLGGAAHSLAHGAGRKWARSDAKERLRDRYSPERLERTDLGGRVICRDGDLIYEEAPQAYKDIGRVVQDLVDAGLVRAIATLKPLITYKTKGKE